MPHTLTRKFRVRYYECDAHGYLKDANYLRYMQETAFDASAAAGFDFERYTEMKRLWLVRETGINFIYPLLYNDVVEVKTWVADFRRVSSRRAYEFYRTSAGDSTKLKPEQGQPAAIAYTDWAFIDTSRNRPAIIGKDFIEGFYPEGIPDSFPTREAFPKAPPPPKDVFTTQIEVAINHIDSMQHVNNGVYLDYITECSRQVNTFYGWQWDRIEESGFEILLQQCRIQYVKPAQLGDKLKISTWAFNIKRSSVERHYLIRRETNGELLARVHTRYIWINPITDAPAQIPLDYLNDFAKNIVM
jgi:acyl-CoA thioester hydrolase